MRSKFGRLLALLLMSATVCSSVLPAAAQEPLKLGIAGTRVYLSNKSKAGSISLLGDPNSPAGFQIRVFRWSHNGDGDVLTPTSDVLVSPPMGTVAAASRQVIRVVLKEPVANEERAYRLIIDQLPAPGETPNPAPTSVAMNLRLSIPVFAQTIKPGAPAIEWGITRDQGGHFLTARNTGSGFATLPQIKVRTAQGQAVELRQLGLPYVLTGQERRWRLLVPAAQLSPGQALTLVIPTGDESLEQLLHVPSLP